MEPEWTVSLKVGTPRDPLPTAMLPPPSGPTVSQNNVTRWEPSIQALEPVGKIIHPKYDKYL